MVLAFLNSPQGRKITAAGLTLAAKKLRERNKKKRSAKKKRKKSGIKKGKR